jgi:urease accessory protein
MLARFAVSATVLGFMTLPVLAHPGHGGDGSSLAAGFVHPLLGLDHVLAMVAVGLWAALLGGRAVWMVPATFVACMAGGFALPMAGISLPAVEPGIAASIVVLGLLIAAAVRLPLAPSMALVGLFAVFHGQAHASELTGAAFTFGLGMIAATALLHGAGIGLGRTLTGRHLTVARGLGGVMAGVGLALLGGWA